MGSKKRNQTVVITKTPNTTSSVLREVRKNSQPHKYLIAAAETKGLEKDCIRLDMSKVFRTLQREKLLQLLTVRNVDTGNVTIIRQILERNALNVKSGEIIGRAFKTNIGVLSPQLFTLYLIESLKEIKAELHGGMDHNYARRSSAPPIYDHDYSKSKTPPLSFHLEYADDVEFFCNHQADAKRITNIVEKILLNFNCYTNQWKTEIITY